MTVVWNFSLASACSSDWVHLSSYSDLNLEIPSHLDTLIHATSNIDLLMFRHQLSLCCGKYMSFIVSYNQKKWKMCSLKIKNPKYPGRRECKLFFKGKKCEIQLKQMGSYVSLAFTLQLLDENTKHMNESTAESP